VIFADPSQVEQVIINLVVNARDAMPEGGKLTVATMDRTLDEEYARTNPPAKAGHYVLLIVSDSGKGMDRETQAKAFEPFFTTKAAGQGTGLGLSTVHGIAQQSGGFVSIYSELGLGTALRVYWPAHSGRATTLAPEAGARGGSEIVLLVEDQAEVRSIAATILRRGGYHVIESGSAQEALAASAHFQGRIHLLITDVVMPGLSGRILAERISETRPETRVLYMSGYTDDAILHHGVLAEGVAFLSKPLTSDAMLRKVRSVLDSPRTAS
jgi:two-component system, cell cycle sensor histidine kinase and response regulator CckA